MFDEFANAVLTEIAAPGPLADNGDPGTPVAVWTGRAPGYLKRSSKSILSAETNVKVPVDTFTILDSAGAPIVAEPGPDWEASTVVIEDRRTGVAVARRFTVNAAEHRAAGTIVDSLRLELNAETTP
jgi:hypothetical protein